MVIIGAKGLAKELLTLLSWNNDIENLVFFDDISPDSPQLLYERFTVLTTWSQLQQQLTKESPHFVLGVGNPRNRRQLAERACSLGGKLTTVVSNHALIGEFGNHIGEGVCVLPHAIISCDVEIGKGSLINKAAILSHDVKVGQYCTISPGVKLLGRSIIGEGTEIGTNAVVLPNITIGINCIIGAGAVVTKSVPDGQTVVGIPAKPL